MFQPAATEQKVISAARDRQERCICGDHEEGECVTPAQVARMRAYLAANPGREFACDDEGGDGIVALIVPRDPGPPEILASAACLADLLDLIGAVPAASLS